VAEGLASAHDGTGLQKSRVGAGKLQQPLRLIGRRRRVCISPLALSIRSTYLLQCNLIYSLRTKQGICLQAMAPNSHIAYCTVASPTPCCKIVVGEIEYRRRKAEELTYIELDIGHVNPITMGEGWEGEREADACEVHARTPTKAIHCG